MQNGCLSIEEIVSRLRHVRLASIAVQLGLSNDERAARVLVGALAVDPPVGAGTRRPNSCPLRASMQSHLVAYLCLTLLKHG